MNRAPLIVAVPLATLLALVTVFAAPGCRHEVAIEPIRIEPIHLTIDINLRVERALDEFFDFEQEWEEED